MILELLGGNLAHGLLLGGVYGLATMGLSLIFGVINVVNVGHGQFIMVGAFVAQTMFTALGLSPLIAIPAAFVIGMALGFFFFYTVIRRLVEAPELTTLLATFAIGILLEEIAKLIFGADFRGYNWGLGKIELAITTIPLSKIYAFVGSIVIALFLYLWFSKTRLGTAVRAVIEDSEGARVCGVNVDWIYALSFAIGIGLTVMSGVLLTMFIPVGINPYMGGTYTLKAFVIAVLGGLSSPYGAFFAGLIFGLIENGAYVLFAQIPGVAPFSLTVSLAFWMLFFLLLLKPTGLLGK
ncbi:MAG: branched-chain amino acid ABC transporter permease [Deltaproteobacteria bacterium]|nr:branched-chain amino acid ABC transporter permease [Deltaproteobacteria bacterium]MBW2317198.1 branched-chain amino acid ABC transporter permease [Deltaproteobacteria bacterium]OEU46692.1 MAG: branched-chain amino acid ABC transporter permease [Desulfobacterales bacterium S7086C20]